MNHTTSLATLVALTSIAGAASAQGVITTSSGNQWEGFYVGVNAGGAWSTTCNTWTAYNPVVANSVAFNNRDCPNNGQFVGGAQIGYNFVYQQWVWGFGVDYDFWSAKNRNKSFTCTGACPFPQGTYNFSSKPNPNGFAILGPRVGYAIDQWLPYVRAGGVFASGSHDVSASYTPAVGSPVGPASFAGSKNSKSSGWGVGAGVEYQLPQQWSLRLEYTYVNLGKGSNSVASCSSTVANACSAFINSGYSLDNTHNSFTASVIRVGVNYNFGGF
jgi:outer membrane immunogenic protein